MISHQTMETSKNGKAIKLFWCHPRLMDYRKPFFDLVDARYRVKFFFQMRSEIACPYDALYSQKGVISLGLTLSDIVHFYKEIKKADIFITSFIHTYYSIVGIILAKALNKRIIVWEENSTFYDDFHYRVKYWILSRVARWVDAFFVLSIKRKIGLGKFKIPDEKIFVANEYPGYVYHKIKSVKPGSFDIEGKNVILYLGRLIPVKGISYLLEAYSFLEKRLSNTILLIVGNGPLKLQLMEYARHLKIVNIKFLDHISDINVKKYLFDISKMVVVPSIVGKSSKVGSEGGPLVILEALSAGVPVLATDGCSHNGQYITDGINGFSVPHSNSRALLDKMMEILEWQNQNGEVTERVLSLFRKIRGHDYQFEQLEKAITYCLGINNV